MGRHRTYHFIPRLHAHRHTIEYVNARLKRFRRLGTRYEKPAETFFGLVLLVICLDWLHSEVRRHALVSVRNYGYHANSVAEAPVELWICRKSRSLLAI